MKNRIVTISQVKTAARELGVRAVWSAEWKEWRIGPAGSPEEAFISPDATGGARLDHSEALATVRVMAKGCKKEREMIPSPFRI